MPRPLNESNSNKGLVRMLRKKTQLSEKRCVGSVIRCYGGNGVCQPDDARSINTYRHRKYHENNHSRHRIRGPCDGRVPRRTRQ